MKKYKSYPVFGFDYHPCGEHEHSQNILKLKKQKKNRIKNRLSKAQRMKNVRK